MPRQKAKHTGRPCIRCAVLTDSHTDYPLCKECFRHLTRAYCGPKHLTDAIRDGLAALERYRAHLGLTDPVPTSAAWPWLRAYLACRGAYVRHHHGRLPPTGKERGIYSTESLRKSPGRHG